MRQVETGEEAERVDEGEVGEGLQSEVVREGIVVLAGEVEVMGKEVRGGELREGRGSRREEGGREGQLWEGEI